jgi:5-formyltetrahydrofolate cyclo-ligase
MNPAEAKAALRQKLRAEAARQTARDREKGSRGICERVQKEKVWREARAVLLYMPLEAEADLRPLITVALSEGKTVLLPRYNATEDIYQVCSIADLSRDLVQGRYNITEPGAECPVVELNRLDLALVPGVAFTVNGCRLGRGKGYFDRLLSEVRGWKCGVAFDWQVVAEIPAEEHDIRVDSIVTPTRWLIAPKQGEGGHIASSGRPARPA